MRLIDAERLKDVLEKNFGHTGGADVMQQLIDTQPTIVPKTGHWIIYIDDLFPGDSAQECSVCHEWQFINGNDDNYCPNCGAKMEEENNEYTNKRKF